jgi:hypothetical protein
MESGLLAQWRTVVELVCSVSMQRSAGKHPLPWLLDMMAPTGTT